MKMFLKFRTNRYATAGLATIAVFIFYLLQSLTSWLGLLLSGVRGYSKYIDQASILNSAECFKTYGIDVYSLDYVPNGCGGFQYSIELLRFLNITKISYFGTEALGNFFMWLTVTTLCSVFFLIKKFGKSENLVALFAFVSPGIWLLLERGNYDEVMFCLLVIGGFLLSSKYQLFGILLIAVTVLIKFYTLPAFLVAALYIRNKIARRICLMLSIPMSLYIMFLISRVEAFPSTWYISFGLKSMGLYSQLVFEQVTNNGVSLPRFILMAPGLLLLAAIYIWMKRIQLTTSLYLIDGKKSARSNIYNLTLVVFLSCYFFGMSFDYRLIFLATLVALSPLIFSENRYRTMLVMSGLVSLYLSTFSYGLRGIPAVGIQVIGDIAVAVFVSTQLVYLRQNFINQEFSISTFLNDLKLNLTKL